MQPSPRLFNEGANLSRILPRRFAPFFLVARNIYRPVGLQIGEIPTGCAIPLGLFTRFLMAWVAMLALAGSHVARAATDPAAWRVVQSIGEVSVSTADVKLTKPKPGTLLPASAIIITGSNGRAILSRQGQQIVVQPNSRLELSPDAGGRTVMRQLGGIVGYRVDRRKVPHFEVNTPFLAAIVKGTQFEVSVRDNHAEVNVSEGKVEVRSALSRAATLVRPGAIARVFEEVPDAIQLQENSGKTRDVTVDEGRLEGGTLRLPDLHSSAPDLKVTLELSGSGSATAATAAAQSGRFDGTLAPSGKARSDVAPRLRIEGGSNGPGNKQETTLRLTNDVVGNALVPSAKSPFDRKDNDSNEDFAFQSHATPGSGGGEGGGSGGNLFSQGGRNSFELPDFSNKNSFLNTHRLRIEAGFPWWEVGGGAMAIIMLFTITGLRSRARKRRERDRFGSTDNY